MTTSFAITRVNTILYCRHWRECVTFYEGMGLARNFSSDWLIEFRLNESACLSVADEARASIKSGFGLSITITLQVDDVESIWHHLCALQYTPEAIAEHAWNARRFFLFDPEGNRIEFWSPGSGSPESGSPGLN